MNGLDFVHLFSWTVLLVILMCKLSSWFLQRFWIATRLCNIHLLRINSIPILITNFCLIFGLKWQLVSKFCIAENFFTRSLQFCLLSNTNFSFDQAALWMVFSVCLSVCPSVRPSVCLSVCPSVRLSVCLSVRHTFLTMFLSSYHHEIFRSYHQGPG